MADAGSGDSQHDEARNSERVCEKAKASATSLSPRRNPSRKKTDSISATEQSSSHDIFQSDISVLETETVQIKESPDSMAQSRPRRNTRKSVLLRDFEVSLPGHSQVKEEEPDEVAQSEDYAPSAPASQRNIFTSKVATKVRGRPRHEPSVVQTRPEAAIRGSANISLREINEPIDVEQSESPTPMYEDRLVENEKNVVVPPTHKRMKLVGRPMLMPEMTKMSTLPFLSRADLNDRGSLDYRNQALPFETGAEVDVEAMDMADDSLLELEDELCDDGDILEEEDRPPLLEPIRFPRRARGRPRKYALGEEPYKHLPRRKPLVRTEPLQRHRHEMADKPIAKSEADKINNFNVKLFQDDIGVTDQGDVYATVIPGCLSYLLRKERVLDLLTNRADINAIREQGWMLSKPPRVPPLVSDRQCFAFYIDGSGVMNPRELSNDDLKPWTTTDPMEGAAVIKPNVRKHAVLRAGNHLVCTKDDPKTAELVLTEYSAWLPRCLRLRKKLFYLSRDGRVIGNVLILYDYTTIGDPPQLVSLVHGNDMLRQLQGVNDMRQFYTNQPYVGDSDNPFYDELVMGPREEKFLRVKPSKIGWVNNKILVLKYLINDPAILDAAGFLNNRVPYLPPLITGKGVFVHFAPAALVSDRLSHVGDGLSPWSYSPAVTTYSTKVRTVKRALVQDEEGMFVTSKEPWQKTGLALVETITLLTRCPRLRKKVIFVQRNQQQVLGVVCFMYEYMKEGPVPLQIRPNKTLDLDLQAQGILDDSSDNRLHELERRARAIRARSHDNEVDVEQVEDVVRRGCLDDEQDMVEPMEMIEEEIVTDADLSMVPDSLDGGWDTAFDDEETALVGDSGGPYFDLVRKLVSGHKYLTVRQKRISNNFEVILEWIANSTMVEDRELLNHTKPQHPPLVRNSRAYCFFVSASGVFPHDINRDDFSPWSANATPENPTCYRTKVRKIGVLVDVKTGLYLVHDDADYRAYPFHLVHLYSIHPKESRLRKKITYLMDTATRVIISHVMIVYDYNVEGPLPHIVGPYLKRTSRRKPRRSMYDDCGVLDDVSDQSESERANPFGVDPVVNNDGTICLNLLEMEFLSDRNRILHYLVNKPRIVDSMACLNRKVPLFPPLVSGRGAFAFFLDGEEVDARNLTCDGLGPWSENLHMSDGTIMCRRPKTAKMALGLNREGQLRVLKGRRSELSEFMLNVYAATLPRLPRLKKRVFFVMKDGVQIGHSLIAYYYTEPGDLPTPVSHGNAIHSEQMFMRIPPSVKEDAKDLLKHMGPSEVAHLLTNRYDIPVNTKTISNLARSLTNSRIAAGNSSVSRSAFVPVKEENAQSRLFEAGSMQVARTEEVEQSGAHKGNIKTNKSEMRLPAAHMPNQTGNVFKFAQKEFNTSSDSETFDILWRLLLRGNEQLLLKNIHKDFGVEIAVAEGEREQEVVEEDASHDMSNAVILDESHPVEGGKDVSETGDFEGRQVLSGDDELCQGFKESTTETSGILESQEIQDAAASISSGI